MPLASRRIDPVASYVRFEALPQASSEGKLQGVAVSHMAGLIHQLSWLAGYSAEMFNGVFKAQADTFQRLQVLAARTERAAEMLVTAQSKMAQTVPISLVKNLNSQRDWKSDARTHGNQLLTPQSRSAALHATYDMACPPPALHLMDPFMDDPEPGVCMKKYSYPLFFFEQWLQLLIKQKEEEDAKRAERRKGRKKKKKPKAEKKTAKKVEKKVFTSVDLELMGVKMKEKRERQIYDDWEPRATYVGPRSGRAFAVPGQVENLADDLDDPVSAFEVRFELTHPPRLRLEPPARTSGGNAGEGTSAAGGSGSMAPPPPPSAPSTGPPPPPPTGAPPGSSGGGPPPPPPGGPPMARPPGTPPPPPPGGPPSGMPPAVPQMSAVPVAAPPPPPPTPPPMAPAPPPPPPKAAFAPQGGGGGGGGGRAGLLGAIQGGTTLRSVDPAEMKPAASSGTSLLDQIRKGKELKSAAERIIPEKEQDQNVGGFNVAALMAAMDSRRNAISDSDDSDGAWSDDGSDDDW